MFRQSSPGSGLFGRLTSFSRGSAHRSPAKPSEDKYSTNAPPQQSTFSHEKLIPILPRQYASSDWDAMKDVIEHLYLEKNMTAAEVVETLEREHDFHTNVRMCKGRLKKWRFTKNNSKNRRSQFRQRMRPTRLYGPPKQAALRREQQRKGQSDEILESPLTIAECSSNEPVYELEGNNMVLSNIQEEPGTLCELNGLQIHPSMENRNGEKYDHSPSLGFTDASRLPGHRAAVDTETLSGLQSRTVGERLEVTVVDSSFDPQMNKEVMNHDWCPQKGPSQELLRLRRLAPLLELPEFAEAPPTFHAGEEPPQGLMQLETQKAFDDKSSPSLNKADPRGPTQSSTKTPPVPKKPRSTNQGHFYQECCPYYYGEKKFRLTKYDGLNTIYQVDSVGYGAYINLLDVRPCTASCACKSSHFPSTFAFSVEISQDSTEVTFFSKSLWLGVLAALPKTERPTISTKGISVETLLQNKGALMDRLLTTMCPEMELLVYGLLNDGIILPDELQSTSNPVVFFSEPWMLSNPWKRIEENRYRRRRSNRLEGKIDRLDEAFQLAEEVYELDATESVITPGLSLPNGSSNFIAGHHGCQTIQLSKLQSRHHDPVAAEQLHKGTFSISDWITSAVRSGNMDLVQRLIDVGADFEVLDDETQNLSMFIAAEHGDSQVMKALLDRDTDVNKKDQQGMTLIEIATENGHGEVTRLLLDHGAHVTHEEWGKLLARSAGKAQCGLVRLLLNRQPAIPGSPRNSRPASEIYMQEALVHAAKVGSVATMQILLDHGAGSDGLISTPGAELEAALIGAAEIGNYEVVSILLRTDVNLSSMDHRGTALSVAVGNAHYAVVRLLLQQTGGQVVPAIRYLRSSGKRKHIAKLFRILAQVQRDQHEGRSSFQGSLASANMFILRKRFTQQHTTMIQAAAVSSTRFNDFSEAFPHHRDTWATGIDTMRKLCRGQIPESLRETIPFLCLSRAMMETLDELHQKSYIDDFNSDLPRWQMLFVSDDTKADLEAYGDAVWAMWGVDIGSVEPSDFDETILQRFHDLASKLASQADLLYGDVPFAEPGILTSDFCGNMPPHVGDSCMQGGTTNISVDSDPLPEGNEFDFWLQQSSPEDHPSRPNRTLADEIKRDPTIIEPLATFLIAGAIFSIFVIFIQVMHKLSKLSSSMRAAVPSIKTLTQRYNLYENEMVNDFSLVFIKGMCGQNTLIV